MRRRYATRESWTAKQWKEEELAVRQLGCWGVGGRTGKRRASVAAVPTSPVMPCGNTWAALTFARQQEMKQRQVLDMLDVKYVFDMGSDPIGQGSFGVVREGVLRETGEQVVAKCVGGEFSALVQEVILLSALDHPNVVKIYDAFKIRQGALLVMKHGGQALSTLIAKGSLPLAQVFSATRQIATGLTYVHDKRLVHADLKPSNVLVNEEEKFAIADFGNALVLEDETRKISRAEIKFRGVQQVTVCYRAPEVCLGENEFGSEVDIWSLGCMHGEMLSGARMFDGRAEIVVTHQICVKLGKMSEEAAKYYRQLVAWNRMLPFPAQPNWSREATILQGVPGGLELLQSMLEWLPLQRISASRVAMHALCTSMGGESKPW